MKAHLPLLPRTSSSGFLLLSLLVVGTCLVASPALAQEQTPEAPQEDDADFEVGATAASPVAGEPTPPSAVPAEATPAEAPAEPAAPSPSEAATPPAALAEAAEPPPQAAPPLAVAPEFVEPADKSALSKELEREGSNYRRPLRQGLRWWGFVQAQAQWSQFSQDQLDPDGAPLNQDEFGVRRARLRIDRGWEYAFATLELDLGTLGGPNFRIRRAEASVVYRGGRADDETPLLVLTGGVTDVPFGAELGESQRDRLFLEQSLASRALFPTPADVGFKLWGAYQFVDYAVALVNGQPLTDLGWLQDLNAPKDVAGRIGTRLLPRDNLRFTGGVSFYIGQGFSPGAPATKDTLAWFDDNQNSAVDAGEIQGTPGSSAIASQNYRRWGTALDLGVAFVTGIGVTQVGGELFLAQNLDRGVLPIDPITAGANTRQFGASFFALQQLSKWFALGARGSFYDPNSNLIEQRAGVLQSFNQSYWEISPTAAVTFDRARLTFEYDFLLDHLGRDESGAPTDQKNDHWALRLQVDL